MKNPPHYCFVRRYTSAQDLPKVWDHLATSYFQCKTFLEYNEKYNSCGQRYYMTFEGETAAACAVVYTLSVDLFTFSNIPSPMRMQIIGLPVSVSASGIFGRPEAVNFLIRHILNVEKGLMVGLNLPLETDTGKGVKMRMLPTLELARSFDGWDEYLHQLRAPYRRRCRQITEKWAETRVIQGNCSDFSNRHYQLYRDVLKHSTTKLETLSEAYFKNLPPNFTLTTYYAGDEMLCWHVNCQDKAEGRMYFFFGGHQYKFNRQSDAYFNNLMGVLREGIEAGFSKIDFGQTAEIPKMRLGGAEVPKALFLYHRNPFVLFLLKKFKWFVEYRRALPEHNVFNAAINIPDYENTTCSA